MDSKIEEEIEIMLKCCKDGNFTDYYEKVQQFMDKGRDAKLITEYIQRKRDIEIYFKAVLEDYNMIQAIRKTRDKFNIKVGSGFCIDINLFIEF